MGCARMALYPKLVSLDQVAFATVAIAAAFNVATEEEKVVNEES